MLSIPRSRQDFPERLSCELPSLSPKKSLLLVKNNVYQLSPTPEQKKVTKIMHKSQQSIGTKMTDKLSVDPMLSPTIQSRKSIRLDRFSNCSFLPHKKLMLQSQCLDIATSIKQLQYKDQNLMQVLGQIAYMINELKQYKSEKGLISQIEKLLNSHSRFQELSFLFLDCRLKDLLQAETLFKKIYNQFTFRQDNRIVLKKNKPDYTFMQLLMDFLSKLEEQFKNVCENQFLGLQQSMLTQRIKLQNKEIEVQNQLASQDKKDSYYQLQQFLKSKTQMNKRILESNLYEDIHSLEEKNGKFKFIDMNNRFIANKIDDILRNIK